MYFFFQIKHFISCLFEVCFTYKNLPSQQEDAKQDAVDALYNDILNKTMLLNIEYRGGSGSPDYVSLKHAETDDDVVTALITEGYLTVEARKEKRLAKMVSEYQKAQEEAKRLRVRPSLF